MGADRAALKPSPKQVENAMIHGIDLAGRSCTLSIKVEIKAYNSIYWIHIAVQDDRHGFNHQVPCRKDNFVLANLLEDSR